MNVVREGQVGGAFFTDRQALARHLAAQNFRGELCMFLGAGISLAAGAPTFKDLVNNLREKHGLMRLSGEHIDLKLACDDVQAEIQKKVAARHPAPGPAQKKAQQSMLASDLRLLLYSDAMKYEDALRGSAELETIMAMSVASRSGGISQIVTFNLDSLLEEYLDRHGVHAVCIDVLPELRRSDVVQIITPTAL